MKTLILICLLSFASAVSAQEAVALHLWADAQRLGPVQETFTTPGLVEELPFTIMGKVSSLEVADGYTVTLYDREDADTHQWLVLIGPCEVNDLEAVPKLSLKGNWDDAVGSVLIERTAHMAPMPGVVAEVRE